MIKPKASIIVPAYQVEDYLYGCLEPLMEQHTSIPYEVIVIDDGTNDSSGKIAEFFHFKYPKIVRVFHTGNQGLPVARNFGMSRAMGDDIMFVDSDDIPSLDFVEILESELHKKANIDCVNAGYQSMDKDGKIHVSYSKSNAEYSGLEAAQKLLDDVKVRAYVWCKAFKRRLLEDKKISFYPYRTTFEDLPFVFSAFLSSEKVVCTKKVVYTYRTTRPGSILNGGAKRSRLLTHASAIFACRAFADTILPKKKSMQIFSSRKLHFYAQMIPDTGFYKNQKIEALNAARMLLSHIGDEILPVGGTFLEKAVRTYGGDDVKILDGSKYDLLSDILKKK